MTVTPSPAPLPPSFRDTLEHELWRLRDSEKKYENTDYRWAVRRLVESAYAAGFKDGFGVGHRETGEDLREEVREANNDRRELVRQFKALLGEEAESAWADQDHDPAGVELHLEIPVLNEFRGLLGLDPIEPEEAQ